MTLRRRDLLQAAVGAALGAAAWPRIARSKASRPHAALRGHWETTPLYGHLGKAAGDFTSAELATIVDLYSLVTIEKAQGLQRYGSTEAGAAAAFRQIKSAEPATRVLFYFNAAIDWREMYAYGAKGAAPAKFYLKGRDGDPVTAVGEHLCWDVSQPDMRAWWIDTAAGEVERIGYDGIFVDATLLLAAEAKRQDLPKRVALQDAAAALLAELRARLGKGRLILYNGLSADPWVGEEGGRSLLVHADGVMIEHFDFLGDDPPARMVAELELCRSVDRAGKLLVFKGWPRFNFTDQAKMKAEPPAALRAEAAREIDFSLAAFLIVSGPNNYFDYGWGYRFDQGPLETFAPLQNPLGRPEGEAVRSGTQYRRAFARAKVSLDLETRIGHIEWR